MGRGCAPESLTTVGDYALVHALRSRLGAGLPRSPQDSAGPKGSRTLEFWSFSGPTQARAAADRLAGDHDRQGNSRSAAQVPGRQWQTKGAGCTQLIVRLKAAPGTETIASRMRPDCWKGCGPDRPRASPVAREIGLWKLRPATSRPRDRAPIRSHGGELHHKGNPWFLALTATGVVFGDIGTSPLYTLSVTLSATGHPVPTAVDVLGIISLVFWALMAMVS